MGWKLCDLREGGRGGVLEVVDGKPDLAGYPGTGPSLNSTNASASQTRRYPSKSSHADELSVYTADNVVDCGCSTHFM